MIPRLDIQFPLKRQWQFWCGMQYQPKEGEYLLNHARSGIVMALKATFPSGGRVGVVAYNCHTVANAVANAGCTPVFMDVTERLTIDIESIQNDLDAIVVTNLFGIRNDIMAIRKRCPKATIIVDNAHGYGLPAEGDFTVYSINQGKFPALGEGGILIVKSEELRVKSLMDERYAALPSYGFIGQLKLFCSMLVKAMAYSHCMYWLTMKVKGMRELGSERIREKVVMRKMAKGVSRMYNAWLPNAEMDVEKQRRNAERIDGAFYGENAFMAIVRTDDPAALKAEYAKRGVETETHFKNAIVWARQFGYVEGSCSCAEELTKKLVTIPTYTRV